MSALHARTPSLLIVDDDDTFRDAARIFASRLKYQVQVASTLQHARALAPERHFNLVLLDLSLPDGNGLELLDEELHADRIAVVTGNPTLDTATRAVGSRVSDYLVKPLPSGALQELLRRAATSTGSEPGLEPDAQCGELIGRSGVMRQLFGEIRRVAPTDLTVLAVGETGTGKELVARAVHQGSGRSGPFVAINCGAVAPELLASELFGHERGSFTGAHRQHVGCFERADGGTLFLDEITEMPLALQAHLLRVLETRRITRVGGHSEQHVDLRVVAACNRDPQAAVRNGLLREDLLYRLLDFPIELPPLRAREDDVVLLAQVFLDQLNRRHETAFGFAPGTERVLRGHDWPGNVRELHHSVRRGYLLAQHGMVRINPSLRRRCGVLFEDANTLTFSVGTSFDEMQRRMLLKTLAHFGNDKTRTARALGVSVKTIYNHLGRLPQDELPGG
jgi:DNA-binding NtrC family response regulator